MAIVAAGPIANFLLAFVFFWILAMLGTQQVRPVIGEIKPDSLAEAAGLVAGQEIVGLDGVAVNSWSDIGLRLIRRLGETGTLQVEAVTAGNSAASRYTVQLDAWQKGVDDVDPLGALGIEPWRPPTQAVLTHFDDHGPALAAGLQLQDRVLARRFPWIIGMRWCS